MNQQHTLLTFPINDLRISVDVADAYVLMDATRSRVRGEDQGSPGQVMHEGKLVPCLDLGRCLGGESFSCRTGGLTLILEFLGEFLALQVPSASVTWRLCSSKSSEVGPEFRGMARLLLAEQVHAVQGDSYLLDVEMALHFARHPDVQPMELSGAYLG